MSWKLFVTQNCEECKKVKSVLEFAGLNFEEVDASTDSGVKLAEKYGIGRVPALIELDKKGDITDSARGLEEIDKLLSHG